MESKTYYLGETVKCILRNGEENERPNITTFKQILKQNGLQETGEQTFV